MNAELDEPAMRAIAGGASPAPASRTFNVAGAMVKAAAAKARGRHGQLPGTIRVAAQLPGASTPPGNASAMEAPAEPSCLWTPLADYSGDWKTGCGREWNSLGGTEEPRQGMRCFACGKPVALPPRPHT